MKMINKLERKFGRYAIKNLSLYLILGYVIGYLLLMFAPQVLSKLILVPAFVMQGEVWRLLTWVITPPELSVSIFTIIMLFFYYSIGNLLERSIGTFLYNLYIFGGMFLTMAGTMIAYILCQYAFHIPMSLDSHIYIVSSYYICLSLFLAVAACYPDMQVLYAMIIPVKMKWLSVLYLVFIGYYFMNANLMGRVNIVMSLLNFVIFYFSTKDFRRLSPKQIKRRRNYAKQVRVNNSENVTHKCYVCGITDKEAPDMQFRYCSRCTGNKEYCQDHLFTHEHK